MAKIQKDKTVIAYDPESGQLVGMPSISVEGVAQFCADGKARHVNKALKEVEKFGAGMLQINYHVRLLTKTFAEYFRGMAENDTIMLSCAYGQDGESGFGAYGRIGSEIDFNDPHDYAMFTGMLALGHISGMATVFGITGVINGVPSVYGYHMGADSGIDTLDEEGLDKDFFDFMGMDYDQEYRPNHWDFSISFNRNVKEYLSQYPVDEDKIEDLMERVDQNLQKGMDLYDACQIAQDTGDRK